MRASPYPPDWWRGQAPSSPVGRVLLHLAGRYGVPLEESPPPVDVQEADRLVLVRPAIADQLIHAGEARQP